MLGEGGFGRVLRARDRELDRLVAVKLIKPEVDDEEFRARFHREARLSVELGHPHVVPVHDHGLLDSGESYFVQEFVAGGSLTARVGNPEEPRWDQAIEWGVQIAGALAAAHARGVIHRDVKPANVLLRDTGEALLCDFGIARRSSGKTVQTKTGHVLGSPSFMAPELFLGDPPSPASDQFALAASLFEILYGQTVYASDALPEILRRASTSEPIRIPDRFLG